LKSLSSVMGATLGTGAGEVEVAVALKSLSSVMGATLGTGAGEVALKSLSSVMGATLGTGAGAVAVALKSLSSVMGATLGTGAGAVVKLERLGGTSGKGVPHLNVKHTPHPKQSSGQESSSQLSDPSSNKASAASHSHPVTLPVI
jgi:hypothetical protein